MENYLRNVHFSDYFGLSESELHDSGAIHTAKEIYQQPVVWLKTYQLIRNDRTRIRQFFDKVFASADTDIILTGAGSSSFIGTILQGPFAKFTGRCSRAVATTDLLTHPEGYIRKNKPVLLISFARSGNSPESSAVVSLVNSICDEAFHLIITCNSSGRLVTGTRNKENELAILLPGETDDKSLVMTSSFTSMLLAGILITRINNIEEYENNVHTLVEYGRKIITNYAGELRSVAAMEFERVVFLGSGPLLGAAEESQLKVQELTDGKVVGKHDSYLGFRHGPKAVINPNTLIIYLFSNQEYVFSYETDLVRDVNAKEKGLYRVGIIESEVQDLEVDLLIELSEMPQKLDEEFLAVCSVIPAQLLGFYTCLKYKLRPDNPSQNGSITRIVEGVNIYPFETT
ncbi:MAG TPA: SIS domain-containing protein [Flavitalea sp.]|nr:SIS domain-containing protein [Flavitalea sp.]